MAKKLTAAEGQILLAAARQAIQDHLAGTVPLPLDLQDYPSGIREPGACFVTLTKNGILRGCIGSLEATQPLIKDVQERAVGAAFQDPRFPALTPGEFPDLQIEVSHLTRPENLVYSTPQDLVGKLRPGIDGVILRHNFRRATFLPQVWDQLPETELFLGRLCLKMGLDPMAWKEHHFEVEIYQAEKFIET
jgi:AmmeMemoRadiSam system protein A